MNFGVIYWTNIGRCLDKITVEKKQQSEKEEDEDACIVRSIACSFEKKKLM